MRRRRRCPAVAVVVLSIVGLVVPALRAPVAGASTISPANPGATSAARSVLNWLGHLPNRSDSRVASGYFGGYTNIGDDGALSLSQIDELHAQTGQYPAILGCDYAQGWAGAADPTTLIDYSCNPTLRNWSTAGGLVTLNLHLPSPANPGGGGLNTPMANFADLLSPSTASGARWRAQLDKIALGLQQLETDGVPVLFRPFHEMNGSWFWWGNRDPATFRQVWQEMYAYLTTTKGLDNLLWVYSPDAGPANRTAFYPGAAYVDIVGADAYHPYSGPGSANADAAYAELSVLGKPFAFTEVGTQNGAGSFDFTQWSTALRQRYPAVTYVFSWNSQYGLARNSGASGFMNDAWIVNRGEVNLGLITEPTPPGSETLLAGFESSTEGWTGVSVTGGPWRVNEWASQGSWSLKADATLGVGQQIYLARVATRDLSAVATLRATARVAPWGNHGSGTQARISVKVGPAWTWYEGGTVIVGSGGTTLTMDISGVPNRTDVREIGVQFLAGSGSSGGTAVYVDDVTTSAPPPPTPAVVAGAAFYSDGTSSRSGPSGTRVSLFATSAEPSFAYTLVSGRAGQGSSSPCSTDVVPISTAVRYATNTGFVSQTAGALNRPPGQWQVCFLAAGQTVTGSATFTVTG